MTRTVLAFVLGVAVGAGGMLLLPSEPPQRQVIEATFTFDPPWRRCPPPVTIETPLARAL